MKNLLFKSCKVQLFVRQQWKQNCGAFDPEVFQLDAFILFVSKLKDTMVVHKPAICCIPNSFISIPIPLNIFTCLVAWSLKSASEFVDHL